MINYKLIFIFLIIIYETVCSPIHCCEHVTIVTIYHKALLVGDSTDTFGNTTVATTAPITIATYTQHWQINLHAMLYS